VTRFPQLFAFLTGEDPARKTPPLTRRGSPNYGLNSAEDTLDMVVSVLPARKEAAFGINTIHEGRLNVTPAFAGRVLAEMNYEAQRALSPLHVAFLADHMRRGTFRPGSQIAFAKLGEKLILTNGQHRLQAVVDSGRPVEFQILIQELETPEQLAAAYYTFDRGARARGIGDVLSSVGIVEKHGIPKRVANAVFQAYPMLVSGFESSHSVGDPAARNDDVRLVALENWWPLATAFYKLTDAAPRWAKERLTTSQGVAAGMVTIKYQPKAAEAFWSGVAEDSGLQRDDPRKTLLTDMASRAWRRSSLDGCHVVASAWNAFFEGRPLKIIRVHDRSRLAFAGTPIGRGR
jgi:hypothetical protein